MGDYADAVIECFGPLLPERVLRELLDPYICVFDGQPEYEMAMIENLDYGGEKVFCARLRELVIPYVFFHAGDHEHAPWTRLFAPGLGEWAGPADGDGRVLISADAIDRVIEQRSREDDVVGFIDEMEMISALALRVFFAERRAAMREGRES
jgi:hypothetical protein